MLRHTQHSKLNTQDSIIFQGTTGPSRDVAEIRQKMDIFHLGNAGLLERGQTYLGPSDWLVVGGDQGKTGAGAGGPHTSYITALASCVWCGGSLWYWLVMTLRLLCPAGSGSAGLTPHSTTLTSPSSLSASECSADLSHRTATATTQPSPTYQGLPGCLTLIITVITTDYQENWKYCLNNYSLNH